MRKEVIDHFSRRDTVLFSYLSSIGEISDLIPAEPETYFFRLCREIIYQQLSNKAGDAILARFETLFPERVVTPEFVAALPHERIRAVGLSNAKASYIRNIAEAALTQTVDFPGLSRMSNDEVVRELTKIKGVGQWTAEMFLMFVLGREDVFSFGDLGLKKGFKKVYGLRKDPSPSRMARTIKLWAPYKTYACLVLWGSLELP